MNRNGDVPSGVDAVAYRLVVKLSSKHIGNVACWVVAKLIRLDSPAKASLSLSCHQVIMASLSGVAAFANRPYNQ